MMGLGYLGSGSSSSSSSNLSPLAPPFTVDRSNPKPNSNPFSHFTETAFAAGVPFSTSLQNWSYTTNPSPGRPDLLVDLTRTSSVPSKNDYGYIGSETANSATPNWSAVTPRFNAGSEPSNLSGSHWSTLNHSAKPSADSFSYLAEAKPYYPPFGSAAVNDDNHFDLTEHNYELLVGSGILSSDGSSLVDYTQSLSGLEYGSKLDGMWKTGAGGKHGKQMERADSFFSKEANVAGSLAFSNHMKLGSRGAESSNKRKEDSTTAIAGYTPFVGRENHTETFSADSKSAEKHVGHIPTNISKATSFGSIPVLFPEALPQVVSPDPPKESWNYQKPYTLYEKGFQIFDASVNEIMSLTNSTAPVTPVIKHPISASPSLGAVSKKVELGNVAASTTNNGGSHKPLKEREIHLTTTNQLNFQIGASDSCTFVAPPSVKGEMPNKVPFKNDLGYVFKARSGFQVPDINIPDVDSTETVKSAEDSPCWKGAPTSRIGPFHDCPTVSQRVEGLDSDFSLSTTKTSVIQKECKSFDGANTGFESAKLSNNQGVQSTVDIIYPRNGSALFYDSGTAPTERSNGEVEENTLPSPVVDSIKTATTMNVQMLIKAMRGLSESLQSHCSIDASVLKEHDWEALESVVGNLNACMSRKLVQVTKTQDSLQPVEGAFAGESQVINETSAAYYGLLNDNGDAKVDKLQSFIPLRDDADFSKDHKMVQTIKMVLDENLQCEEDLQSQSLLYKNLWLEAEAELCSIAYRARYERMKREMKKFNTEDAKGVAENAVTLEKRASFHINPDTSITHQVTPNDSSFSKTGSPGEDVEASVMARFHILKRRDEPNPDNAEEEKLEAAASVRSKFSVNESQGSHVTSGPSLPPHAGKDDAKLIQSCGNKRTQNQVASGWYNSSYSPSDWEHVLKDEFA